MKYINCPQCNNKIIERSPLKCLYCGYDSTKIMAEKLEPLDPPQRPNVKNYNLMQTLLLLVSAAGIIAFLITFLLNKATVVDNVLVESNNNLTTIRYILAITSALSFLTFISSNRTFESALNEYRQELRYVQELNKRIEAGATINDFDEADATYIMNAQEQKKLSQPLNQKTSKYYYNK